MADNIQFDDIQTGVEVAWHKKTNVVEGEVTAENSGVCYDMEFRELRFPETLENGDEVWIQNGQKQLIALDTRRPIGGGVSAEFPLFTNKMGFELIANSFANIPHRIVSAGTVDNRRKVFVSIEPKEGAFKSAAGREVYSVVSVVWGHGGMLKLQTRAGHTIIVCQNTLNCALSETLIADNKHTKNMLIRLPDTARTMASYFGAQAEFCDTLDKLANETMTVDQARNLFAGLLTKGSKLTGDKLISTKSFNRVDDLVLLFLRGAGNRGQDRADCLNAVTDFYSHKSSGGEDTWKQFESSEFGPAATHKSDFYRLIGDTVSDDSARRTKANAEFLSLMANGETVLNSRN